VHQTGDANPGDFFRGNGRFLQNGPHGVGRSLKPDFRVHFSPAGLGDIEGVFFGGQRN